MRKAVLAGALVGAAVVLGAALLVPVGGGMTDARPSGRITRQTMDLSRWSAAPPGQPMRLLFIHHSVGGQLLADEGPERGEHNIYVSHPKGGGLRTLLQQNGYEVHEVSRGSRLGAKTDLFDWLPKFRDHMATILRTDRQDTTYTDGRRNHVVVFKSCFPQSKILEEGREPGSPNGPELTLANAKATMRALLDEFARQPDTLFVFVTTPPLMPNLEPEPLWKLAARTVTRRRFGQRELARTGELSRRFVEWVHDPNGWLAGYPHQNVVAFDYWDVLTGEGRSNLLVYYDGDGTDPHPSAEGNRRAAPKFVDLVNRAVRRAGIVPPEQAAVEAHASADE